MIVPPGRSFAEVRLPKAPPGKRPHLMTKLPEKQWVFVWDARRKTGYILVTPRTKDTREIRFKVNWEG
jgi:hypothetical protein